MTQTRDGNLRSVWLIVNGKQGEVAGLRDGVETLRDRGHDVRVRLTWESGDALYWTLEAAGQGADTVIAGGGDGTVHEVVNGLVQATKQSERAPVLGVVPLGSANDFAAACGVHFELPRALQRVPATPVRTIDLGQMNDRVFANMATGGFGTKITSETPEGLKRILGKAAYFVTGLTRFQGLEPVPVRLRGPDYEWEGELLVLAVGNGRQAGGGHILCPDAALDDGLLDVGVLVPPERGSWREAIANMLTRGGAAISQAIACVRLPWLEVAAPEGFSFNLDGEPLQGKQFRFEALPRAIRMHLPDDSPLLS